MFTIDPSAPSLPEALLNEMAKAETATIGHFEYMGFVDRAIKVVGDYHGVCVGTAVTLALSPQDSTLLHHSVSMLRKGDILVIDRLGDEKFACLGGGVALALKRAGVAAVVVDGAVADVQELREFGLPVWARTVSNITTRLLGIWGAMNVPVSIGGAVVMPGDAVICDENGVVILRPDQAPGVVAKAIKMQQDERAAHPKIGVELSLGDLTGASKIVRDMMASKQF